MALTITISDLSVDDAKALIDFLSKTTAAEVSDAPVQIPLELPATAVCSSAAAETSTIVQEAGKGTSSVSTELLQLAQSIEVAAQNVAAQLANPVPPAITPSQVPLDKDGLPWDARIHSSGENKLNKDGTWRAKRNVDPELVKRVLAEIRQMMSIPSAAATSPVPPPPVVSAEPTQAVLWPHAPGYSAQRTLEVVPPPPAPPVQTTAVPVPPPIIAPQPAAVPVPETMTFPQLVAKITGSGKSNDEVLGVLNLMGIPSVPMVAARPDLIPAIAAALGLA